MKLKPSFTKTIHLIYNTMRRPELTPISLFVKRCQLIHLINSSTNRREISHFLNQYDK